MPTTASVAAVSEVFVLLRQKKESTIGFKINFNLMRRIKNNIK
jgi:hypothetical protein